MLACQFVQCHRIAVPAIAPFFGAQRCYAIGKPSALRNAPGRDGPEKPSSDSNANSEGKQQLDTFFKNSGVKQPPGFEKMMTYIASQPPNQQVDILKKMLDIQKKMTKIPGVGRVAKYNVEQMESALKRYEEVTQRSYSQTKAQGGEPTGSVSGGRPGPSLDELKKVNLGPEIEALFAELREVRAKKNEYRASLISVEATYATVKKDLDEAQRVGSNLREKLRQAEKQVMSLNEEVMRLTDKEGNVATLQLQKAHLEESLQRLKNNDTTPLLERIASLERAAEEREKALRASQRRLQRLRRRDPLQQFSLLLSELTRRGGPHRCDPLPTEREGTKGSEQLFASLQDNYYASTREAWYQAFFSKSLGAQVFATSAQMFLQSHVQYARFDALVTLLSGGALQTLQQFCEETGFELQEATHSSGNAVEVTYEVTWPKNLQTPEFLGPYGAVVALSLVHGGAASKGWNVVPIISQHLLENPHRTLITYESSRSSGPGGQAANVTETQIQAKLSVDDELLYFAEAQDSRSATTNRESAVEKLKHAKRLAYHDQLAKSQKLHKIHQSLQASIAGKVASGAAPVMDEGSGSLAGFSMPEELVTMLKDSLKEGQVKGVERAAVSAILLLSRASTDTK